MIAEHRGPRAQCTATWYTVHEICNICYTAIPSLVFNGKGPVIQYIVHNFTFVKKYMHQCCKIRDILVRIQIRIRIQIQIRLRIRILLFLSLTFKTPTKTFSFYVFLLITFESIFTSCFKDKKS
jgi:hypothetical protein